MTRFLGFSTVRLANVMLLLILTCLDMGQFKLPLEKSRVNTTILTLLGTICTKEAKLISLKKQLNESLEIKATVMSSSVLLQLT